MTRTIDTVLLNFAPECNEEMIAVRAIREGGRGSTSSVQQTPLQHRAGRAELGLPGDLRAAGRQAVAQLFQRVAGHVRALVAGAGNARDRQVAVARELALELPQHVR